MGRSTLTKWFPIGWALSQTLKNGYTRKHFIADLQAGFVVSLIALPLSMALAVAIGMEPQHGIYTAIVAGIAAGLLGGSHYQVSGPTAAFVVILIPIVSNLGVRGILWCQILAGIMLMLFSIARLGNLIRRMPACIITGFTTGIALVLAIISLKDFLGLHIDTADTYFIHRIIHLIQHLPNTNGPEACIGVCTLFVLLLSKSKIKYVPAPILGVIVGTLLGIAFNYYGYAIATIGTQFNGLPALAPHFQLPTFQEGHLLTIPSLEECKVLLFPAFMIACLAALESLLSAAIADNMTQTQHHPNAELNGIGIANILSAFAGGIPATAALARTATSIQQGAQSPFAAVLHALFILLYVLLLAPIICFVPMSSLAALLLLTAVHMSHLKEFIHTLKTACLTDRLVLFFCFLFTTLTDMVIGISVGLGLLFLLSRRVSFFISSRTR